MVLHLSGWIKCPLYVMFRFSHILSFHALILILDHNFYYMEPERSVIVRIRSLLIQWLAMFLFNIRFERYLPQLSWILQIKHISLVSVNLCWHTFGCSETKTSLRRYNRSYNQDSNVMFDILPVNILLALRWLKI